MQKPIIKAIIFDFHGVLCRDYFYSSLKESHPIIHEYVENKIFRNSDDLVNQWMRNNITSDHINEMISRYNDIQLIEIKRIFLEDVVRMKIDNDMISFALQQKQQGRKIALTTDNMDVFSKLTVPNHKLNNIFDIIINSADYGLLKEDQNGKLFDIAMEKLGENYNNTLLIDDSLKVKPIFEAKGGLVHTYKDFQAFVEFCRDFL